MGQLGGGEQAGGGIRTGRHAGATADAGGGIKGQGSLVEADQLGVGVRGAAGVHRAVTAGGDDPVQRRTVHRQVLQQREGPGSERLQHQGVAIPELAQIELADGGGLLGTVGLAVHEKTAGAADPLTAVVLEMEWAAPLHHQLLVEQIERLQQRQIRREPFETMRLESAGRVGAVLAPEAQRQADPGSSRGVVCPHSGGDPTGGASVTPAERPPHQAGWLPTKARV